MDRLIWTQGEDIDALTDALERNEGRKIYLQIYSTKRKELRGRESDVGEKLCSLFEWTDWRLIGSISLFFQMCHSSLHDRGLYRTHLKSRASNQACWDCH